MTHNCNECVKIIKKLASLCFESFGKAHKHRKIFIGHTYQPHPLKLACFLFSAKALISVQINALDADAACGVCGLAKELLD